MELSRQGERQKQSQGGGEGPFRKYCEAEAAAIGPDFFSQVVSILRCKKKEHSSN